MPRARFFKLDDETRERILGAARAEFATDGYSGASFNRIIERAGMSKGSVYYYFDDKADLFLTVVELAFTDAMQSIGGLMVGELPESDFWGECERVMLASWGYLAEHPELAGLARAAMSLRPDSKISGRLHESYEQMYEGFERALAHGQTLGEIRTDLPLSFLARVLFAMGEAADRWSFDAMETGALDLSTAAAFGDNVITLFKRVAAPVGS